MNQNPTPCFAPFSPPDSALQTEKFARKYKNARQCLLLVPIFTILNLVMLIGGLEVVFLFSAAIPYQIAAVSVNISETLMGAAGIAVIGFVIALAIIALYFLCYMFSKKSIGWMIAALVLFSLDFLLCLAYMLGVYLSAFDSSVILDIVIHGWVLYYLITGVYAGTKLKALTVDMDAQQVTSLDQTLANTGPEDIGKVYSNLPADGSDSLPLRSVDPGTKARILVEANTAGHHLCFRRVKLPAVRKRVNELVIDGYVFAETPSMFLESPHSLCAKVNGKFFSAHFDGGYCYLFLDGVQLVKNNRFY